MKFILPEPGLQGNMSVEEALYRRVSRRSFHAGKLTRMQAGQLLWAAGGRGMSGDAGISRSAPSAGATYPLEIYLVAGDLEDTGPGLYHYLHHDHSLVMVQPGDLRMELARAALGQRAVARAPVSIIPVADYARTTGRYGERGYRYVHMEVGHVAQNIYLQSEALNLATVAIGAFDDDTVKEILAVRGAPLLIMPVGHRMDG
ncbi:MAG: SagB/ThcOx family dehydrogenase [Firmicutes bacterium]|jgi:SagB-type dehydrogenase family enzyme|nr:SagB/ThcOx family dehydrogenase [Bacillota bacterium]